MVITSAGCNALDYLLGRRGEVNAVDVNPHPERPAGAEAGRHPGPGPCRLLRAVRPAAARRRFARCTTTCCVRSCPTLHAATGTNAHRLLPAAWRAALVLLLAARRGCWRSWPFNAHVHCTRLREPMQTTARGAQRRASSASSTRSASSRVIWTPWLNWFLSRSFTLTLLGVPLAAARPDHDAVSEGVAQFIRDSLEDGDCNLPFRSNYFWRVYFQGSTAPTCCPEYLKKRELRSPQGRAGRRLHIHTTTVTEFLHATHEGTDALRAAGSHGLDEQLQPAALTEEWDAIFARAGAGARAIFRSAHAQPGYLAGVSVTAGGRRRPLQEVVQFHPELSRTLALRDRVHTYAGFHIADLRP